MTSNTQQSIPLSIKLLSVNAKGLNIPEKRTKFLNEFHKQKANIICIQETHFKSDKIPKFHDMRYPTAFHASNTEGKTKGVSILISNRTPFQVQDTMLDPGGRYIFIKGKLENHPMTIANVYAPNSRQVTFFRKIKDLLTTFASGILVLGGDFNIPLDPLIDTSNGTSSLPYRALKQIKIQLKELTLHDTWRTLYPQTRDFTYFSNTHQKYSRIDYFFLSQPDLTFLTNSTIEPMTLSDHHPITLSLTFPEKKTVTKTWRLNTAVLKDPADVSELREKLLDYFSRNENDETSSLTQWEAHKCVIRGEFIKKIAKLKRESQLKIKSLIDQIHKLEMSHKRDIAISTLDELTKMRAILAEELNLKTKRQYVLRHRIYYEQGNKSGKLLAKAVQSKKISSTIHQIRDNQGKSYSTNEEIANQFEAYYHSLYNLPSDPKCPQTSEKRAKMIRNF